MGKTKGKLRKGEPALGGWIMIGHPTVAEIMAGEGFDWIAADMEHTSTDVRAFHEMALALKGTGVDLLARLHSCDPVLAKKVLDAGGSGIIVPFVNTREEAELAVAMAKFPPVGFRGSSFYRAADFGRNFKAYFRAHNDSVIVAVMMEHFKAVENADAILSVPGIDAVFVGPYDLSASMGRPGELSHPDVVGALQKIVDACKRHGVPPGLHVVAVDPDDVQRRIEQGYRFIACGVDTEFVMYGCRKILERVKRHG
jgi:2-keto-3-deoxy-L-rhamnonate aldolase RhmA